MFAACTETSGGEVNNTEVNLLIVNPDDPNSELAFEVSYVDYRITCEGTAPGSAPIPPGDTGGTTYPYDDSVDITGKFEIVDDRDPPIWQAVMDLPPTLCTITMSVADEGGEIVCIGSETMPIVEGGDPDLINKFDIVLLCTLSVDIPDGILDVDGSFSIVTGNLCPFVHVLMAVPSTVDIDAVPPTSMVEYRSVDPDTGCGDNCDPVTCDSSAPPVCTPSPYNPADPRCNPAFGGDPLNPECQDGTASGLVCTLTATPSAAGVPGGDFLDPLDGVTPVGPVLPINLDDALGDGTGSVIPGLDVDYLCDAALPGSVTISLVCSDGDVQCDRVETFELICPGVNYCDGQAAGLCEGAGDCLSDGACAPTCDPLCDPGVHPGIPACPSGSTAADECTQCPGMDTALPANTACTSVGGQVCDGAGACVECNDASHCDASLLDCREPAQCAGNVCQPRQISSAGTPCSNGVCDAAGDCQLVPIDPPATTETLNLGCSSDALAGVIMVPFELTVDPGSVVSGVSLGADATGVAQVPEVILDQLQAVLLGGVARLNLIDLQATVHARSGGSGADLLLTSQPIAHECALDGAVCDPLNDDVGVPGNRGNSDCAPQGPSNPCGRFLDVPTSADCAPAGACDSLDAGLGVKNGQCTNNGFCVTGALHLPLDTANGSFIPAPSGTLLFGWDDQSTGATLDVDGTWVLPSAVFADPLGPNAIRFNAAGLPVSMECTLAVDSDDPVHGVGVPEQSSPTPDALLVGFPIQVP